MDHLLFPFLPKILPRVAKKMQFAREIPRIDAQVVAGIADPGTRQAYFRRRFCSPGFKICSSSARSATLPLAGQRQKWADFFLNATSHFNEFLCLLKRPGAEIAWIANGDSALCQHLLLVRRQLRPQWRWEQCQNCFKS